MTGCGDGAGPLHSPRADRLVARWYARALLANRENHEAPPTEAEIDDLLAKGVAATCTWREGSDYDCQIKIPGFATYAACAAVVVGETVSNVRCGSTGTAPHVASEYVDCSTVGSVKAVADPVEDTFAAQRDNTGRLARVADPAVDVTSVKVARGGDQLCADVTFASVPHADTQITLSAGRAQPTDAPSESLNATIKPGLSEVSTLNHGSISAKVGQTGTTVSFVARKSSLVPALAYLFDDPFRFEVHVGTAAAQDDIPDAGDWPVYG